MPRPRKVGLSYFPEDTNRRNDFKIMDLLNEYGPLGYTIYDFCLQYIYENGYYIDVPRHQLVLMLIKDIGAKWVKNKDLVWQVIDYCAEIGLFDNALLQQNIMTSVGIQRRYDLATVRNKVDKTKHWLLDDFQKQKSEVVNITVSKNPDFATETPETATETPETATETPHIKEKINKRKINNNLAPSSAKADPDAADEFIKLPLNDKSFYSVPLSDVEHFKELYPAVNVEQELRSMLGWLEANPRRRKTRSGIKAFITKWLSKTQNQGGVGYGSYSGSNVTNPVSGEGSGAYRTGEKVF